MIAASPVLAKQRLSPQGYFLASAHREENVDDPARLATLVDAMNALAEAHGLPVLVSTHPRTRARLEKLEGVAVDPLVRFEKPFGFFDYIHLQQQAACVLSDSGTITEESAILGFPAVTIRDTHERPEGMDAGVLAMCGLGRDTVLPAVAMIIAAAAARGEAAHHVPAYQPLDVSWKVLKLVTSYIPYVRERVWSMPPA